MTNGFRSEKLPVEAILAAILENDIPLVKRLINHEPALVARRVAMAKLYDASICHWLYVGDCTLHLAAAGYRTEISHALISASADPNFTLNHRRRTPLRYAADGCINGPAWNPLRKVETMHCLLDAGAEPTHSLWEPLAGTTAESSHRSESGRRVEDRTR